jgi:hypothetical protein
MNYQEIVLALNFIRPKAEWSLCDDKLEWLDSVQDEPSKSEIEAGWVAYQAKVEADKVEAAAKKASAEAKLVALGLTADDLTALGL